MLKKIVFLWICLIHLTVLAHDIDYGKIILKEWTLATEGKKLQGSLFMYKNGEVYIEDAQNKIFHWPLSSFIQKDQDYVIKRYEKIAAENSLLNTFSESGVKKQRHLSAHFWIIISILSLLGLYTWLMKEKSKGRFVSPVFFTGLLFLLYGFKDEKLRNRLLTTTDPAFVDSAFIPFKPKVYTHWDNTYFYVESKGIPDHQMMVGIASWQQQVPIPQCYTTAKNNNAWSIPLNPVIGTTGSSKSATFLKRDGASAVNFLPQLQRELIEVISKYVKVNPDDIRVSLEKQDRYEVLEVKIELPEKG